MTSPTTSLARFIAENAPAVTALEPKVERVALLIFELERGLYAVPLDHVREVVRAEGITRIPQAPEHVRGVLLEDDDDMLDVGFRVVPRVTVVCACARQGRR